MAPSGGREPRGESATTPPPPTSSDGREDGRGRKPPEPPVRAEPKPLKISVMVDAADGIFLTRIMPTLQNQCATGGCHATPDVIDLRTVPFEAEGSYAMDDIRARLGDSPDAHDVQKELVKVLIDSMQTLYMPPAPAEPVADGAIEDFNMWLADDLEQSPSTFQGRIVAIGLDAGGKELCDCKGDIVDGVFHGTLDRTKCVDADSATYEVFDQDDNPIASGKLSAAEFSTLDTWLIQVD